MKNREKYYFGLAEKVLVDDILFDIYEFTLCVHQIEGNQVINLVYDG